jgi:pimeloyl-ACP methyl ester carboxylesterase
MLLMREGVRLAGLDWGGDGPPALLLHGLAGYAGEWADTARWLTARCRVVALDARGHGDSERAPDDVSRAAHVADAGPAGTGDEREVEANVADLVADARAMFERGRRDGS